MITWKFKFVMECLPLIMQGSLLLLGYALSRYFWDLSRTVSSVIIAFTAFGFIFYLSIVFAATYSKACPFQTPLSVLLRLVGRRCRDYIAGVYTSRTRLNQTSPLLISNIDGQHGEARADSNCITTMFRMTKASESIIAIMAYIPEITWDGRMKAVPLLQVYQALRESLWRSADGKALVQPGARERAFGSAKALLHLYIQRRCIYGVDEALTNQVRSIDHQRQPLGHSDFDGDFDLQSTFYVVDWAFGVEPQIPWSEFKFSKSHHCWLSHMLQYRAWDSLLTQRKLSEDVRGFLDYSLACDTLPDRVVADCLFIINMVAGNLPQPDELVDKVGRLALLATPFGSLLTDDTVTKSSHSSMTSSARWKQPSDKILPPVTSPPPSMLCRSWFCSTRNGSALTAMHSFELSWASSTTTTGCGTRQGSR